MKRKNECPLIKTCNNYPFCANCGNFNGTAADLQSQLDAKFENTPYEVTYKGPKFDDFEQELYNIILCCGGKFTTTNKNEIEAFIRSHAAILRRIWREEESESKEWSEEDEKFFKTALWHISNSISNGKSTDILCDTTDWLKSLKERLQPNPNKKIE